MDPKTLFTSPYDQKTFTKLLKGLLWDEYQDEGRYETKEIWQGFEYLTHYSRLGDIELDNAIDHKVYKEKVLVLEITQKSINDARVSITKETIKLLKKDIFQWYYTVLVAFRSEANPDNWRFSLIKSNDGKSWNNARRFSYYLGKNEGYKTPKQYLIDAGQIKDLNDLVSRFDVEVVRKEFFNLYINLFLELYQEVKKYQYCFRSVNNGSLIDLVSFSKNLMGKMIFLYFIQKKGWLWLTADQNFKDHPGDPQFFKNNFDTRLARDENLFQWWVNFYNDFLEPLFYSGLNKKNPNDWHEKLQMKVPYLNGWLFEEEYKDRETTPLPLENNLFKAIVDAFDTYNFTIDENDPMDQEIAVDPEMLGKIFEYMISINSEKIDALVDLYNQKKKFKEYPSPDRSVNIVAEIKKNKEINKKLGAFYTPREIVQYMTREALMYSMIEFLSKKLTDKSREELEAIVRELRHCKDKHLTTKDEIEDREWQVATYQTLKSVAFDVKEYLLYDKNSEIKPLSILDPAVWSGAFPMGILQEMTGLVEYLIDTFGLEKKSRYEIKQSIIRDSIYGVDIDPGAVDIARLRFWLSLIVDAHEPIPLPNLEFKFVCANSITPLENDTLFTNAETIIKLRSIKQQYFQTSDYDIKQKLQADFGEAKLELLWFKDHKFRSEFTSLKKFNEYIAELGKQASDAKNKQFNSWEPFDATVSNKRFDSDMMFDTDRFDIVIWNPPYIKEYENRKAFETIKWREYYMGKMDIRYYFTCLWVDYLKEWWVLSFIAQNNWITSHWAKILRNKILDDGKLKEFIDFGDFKVFDGVGIQTMICLIEKRRTSEEYSVKYSRLDNKDFDIKNIGDFLYWYKSTSDFTKHNSKLWIWMYYNRTFDFANTVNNDLLIKIAGDNKFYLNEKEVAQWIVYPQDYLNEKNNKKLWNHYTVWDWIFVLSNNEVSNLQLNEFENTIIKPLYTTKEISRYYANWRNTERLIYTTSDFKNKQKIEQYPKIKEHLDKFATIITSDNKPYWLHRARDERFFKWEKIIVARKCVKPSFSYVDFDSYVSATFYLIKSDRFNLKYLTGLFNSHLIEFWLLNKGKMQGDNYQLDKDPLLNIPIKSINDKNEEVIVRLVNEIISLKVSDPKSDTSSLERKIDILVYKLYELTLEDSQIIDPTLTQEEWDRVDFE